jgi:tetratricopeptide (TPR) repeat protein
MNKLSKIAVLGMLAAGALAASGWADRGEYDLVLTIRAEASPEKRIALLERWKEKYPKSELQQQRRELYLSAYATLGDSPHMLDVAKEMVDVQPDNFVGIYWLSVLLPESKTSSPEMLGAGEKAARQLLAGLNTYFNPESKPTDVPAEGWALQRGAVERIAHRSLGWIQWQKGEYAAAETEFTANLRQDPKNAEASAWLGSVLACQKQPEKQVAALWHLTRAASLRDEGALPDSQRRLMDTVSEQLYAAYHGATNGLEELRTKVVADAFPAADFSVESAAVIAARRAEEELNRTNPELAAWLRIRKRLDTDDGEAYFSQSLHNAELPKLKGTLLRFEPAKKPKTLVLALSDTSSEEVTLQLSAPFPNEAEAGIALEFEGTADSFTRAPFRLTLTAAPDKVTGWPDPPAPVRRK